MRFLSFALLSAAVALTACGTDEVGPTGFEPNQPTGRIRFVHAISGTTTVNVTVDAVPLGVSIAYAGTAPVAPILYYPAYAGTRQFAVRRTADTSVHLLDAAVPVVANTDHTVIAVGSATTATALVLTDNNAAPAAGNVKIRAVNAMTTGSVDVYVTAPNADIATIAPTFAGLAARAASAYLERTAGAIQVRFTTAGTKTVVRDVSLGTVAAGAIRTVVLLEAATGGPPPTSVVLTDR